jgi:thiamine biosynthesis lipoprotein
MSFHFLTFLYVKFLTNSQTSYQIIAQPLRNELAFFGFDVRAIIIFLMKNTRKIVLISLLILVVSACAVNPQTPLQRFSNTAIDVGFNDAPVTFIAYTHSAAEFDGYFKLLRENLTEQGLLYDKYNFHGDLFNVRRLNEAAGQGPQTVDPLLMDMFVTAGKWYTLSQETFDITLGAVLNVWHKYRTIGRERNALNPSQGGDIPTREELELANLCTGWDQVVLNPQASTIEILNPCTQFDVGGIAKGYAVDRAMSALIEAGLTSAIVNLGDSSILTFGEKADGTDWGIGIAQPKRGVQFSDNSVDTLYFRSSIAISTSGDNQNYYRATDGNYYAHIIDPVTLFPITRPLHSVTVATTLGATAAEALSKALFILELDEAEAYLATLRTTFPEAFIGAVWVFSLDQSPDPSRAIFSEGFSVIHSENIKPFSRLHR